MPNFFPQIFFLSSQYFFPGVVWENSWRCALGPLSFVDETADVC